MCTNPFKLQDKVSGDYKVEEISTTIRHKFQDLKIKWRLHQGEEILTLNEILEQVKKMTYPSTTPFIEVRYESALWGVIFQIGNYGNNDKTWIVHGITKGYG